jgi:hypothetical protein
MVFQTHLHVLPEGSVSVDDKRWPNLPDLVGPDGGGLRLALIRIKNPFPGFTLPSITCGLEKHDQAVGLGYIDRVTP